MPDRIVPRWIVAFARRSTALKHSVVRSYAFALACVALAALLRLALQPIIGDRLYFTTFFPAIGLVTAVAGLAPGLVATGTSAIVSWVVFMPPAFDIGFSPEVLIQVAVFLVAALTLVGVAALLNWAVDLLVRQTELVGRERQRQSEASDLLVSELNHRLRNLLGLVEIIAVRTLLADGPREEAQRTFHARLKALAVASEAPFAGGQKLGNVLEHQLHAYAGQIQIVHCEAVQLSTEAVQRMALIIHELATNAAKYGALSTPDGRVTLTCEIDRSRPPPALVLRWTEQGGPPIVGPVSRSGFGNVVLKRAAQQGGGTASIDLTEGGLRYVFRSPLDSLAARPSS